MLLMALLSYAVHFQTYRIFKPPPATLFNVVTVYPRRISSEAVGRGRWGNL